MIDLTTVQVKTGCIIPNIWETCALPFHRYMPSHLRDAATSPLPTSWDWIARSGITQWGSMENLRLQDCVEAGFGHEIMMFTAVTRGAPLVLPDPTIEGSYSAITGYDPNNPATDQGTPPTRGLDWWKNIGFVAPDGSVHRIQGYVQMSGADPVQLNTGIYTFGGIGGCFALPRSIVGQQVWDVVGNPDDPSSPAARGSFGGHYMPLFSYDLNAGLVGGVTWGAVQQMTYRFIAAYGGFLNFGVVSTDFLNASGVDPLGVNLTQLLSDMATFPNIPSLEPDVQLTRQTYLIKATTREPDGSWIGAALFDGSDPRVLNVQGQAIPTAIPWANLDNVSAQGPFLDGPTPDKPVFPTAAAQNRNGFAYVAVKSPVEAIVGVSVVVIG